MVDRRGSRSFNYYRVPTLYPGVARFAGPLLDVVDKVVGENRRHVLFLLRPLLIRSRTGKSITLCRRRYHPGSGRTSILEPLNARSASTTSPRLIRRNICAPTTGWLQAVVLRIPDPRDLGDVNRSSFYESLKLYTASPPGVLVVDASTSRRIRSRTSSPSSSRPTTRTDSTSGRRSTDLTLVLGPAPSKTSAASFFTDYGPWFNAGGDSSCRRLPSRTSTWSLSTRRRRRRRPIILRDGRGGRSRGDLRDRERDRNADGQRRSRSPNAFSVVAFKAKIPSENSDLDEFSAKKKKQQLPRRFEEAGYVHVKNPDDKPRGRWSINGRQMPIYAKSSLTPGRTDRGGEEIHRRERGDNQEAGGARSRRATEGLP